MIDRKKDCVFQHLHRARGGGPPNGQRGGPRDGGQRGGPRDGGQRGMHESQSFPNGHHHQGTALWQQFLEMVTTSLRNNSMDDSDEPDGSQDDDDNNNSRLVRINSTLVGAAQQLPMDEDVPLPRRERANTDGAVMSWDQIQELQRQHLSVVRRQDSLDSQGYDFVADPDMS